MSRIPLLFILLSLLTRSSAFTVLSPARVTTGRRSSPFAASLNNNDRDTRINNQKKADFDLSSLNLQGLVEKIQNIDLDWSRLSDSIMGAKENVMSGEFGQRGEGFFVAQVVCLLAILGGGIPLVGGFVLLLLGPGLLLSGLAAVLVSVLDMGSALSPWPKPPAGQGLITNGLYTQCRHPMYAGLLAASAGLAVATDSVPRLAMTAVLYMVLEAKTNLEESELAKVYPSDYSVYKKQVTSKFLPMAALDLLDKTKTN